MLRIGKSYVFGASAATNDILLAPWRIQVLNAFADRLAEDEVNKKTARVPTNWGVDADLLHDIIASCLLPEVG